MNAAEIEEIDKLARANYVYVEDPANTDTWRSRADYVLAGLKWSGDCDDLAMTVIDLCARRGQPLSKLFRLIVQSRNGLHMLAATLDDEDHFWNFGDTFVNYAYRAEQMTQVGHQPIKYNRLDQKNQFGKFQWKLGVPWMLGNKASAMRVP